MGKQEIKNRDWSEAIGNSLRDAEIPPSDQLWARLEQINAVSTPPTRSLKKSFRWVATIAAMLLFGVLTMQLWNSEPIVDNNHFIAHKEQVEEIISSDSTTTDITKSEISNVVVAHNKPNKAPIVAKEVEPTTTLLEIADSNREEEDRATQKSEEKEEKIVEKSDNKSQNHQYNQYQQNAEPTRRKLKSTAMFALNMGSKSITSYGDVDRATPQSLASDLIASNGKMDIGIEQEYKSSSFSHRQPIGAELSVGVELNRHITVVAGLSYTLLASDLTMSFDGRDLVQKVQFIGLPVRLDYNLFERNNFSVYAGAGGAVEYCVSAKVGSTKMDETRLHYSLGGVVGAKYNVNNWLGLYVEPDVSYYFTPTKLRTIRNDSPTTFTIRMGIRFNL